MNTTSNLETQAFAGKLCAAVGGKAFNGDPLPSAADPNKIKQRDGWLTVAEVAKSAP